MKPRTFTVRLLAFLTAAVLFAFTVGAAKERLDMSWYFDPDEQYVFACDVGDGSETSVLTAPSGTVASASRVGEVGQYPYRFEAQHGTWLRLTLVSHGSVIIEKSGGSSWYQTALSVVLPNGSRLVPMTDGSLSALPEESDGGFWFADGGTLYYRANRDDPTDTTGSMKLCLVGGVCKAVPAAETVGETDVFVLCMVVCPHTYMKKIEPIAPTCLTTGMDEYYKCPDCGGMYTDASGTREIYDKSELTVEALGSYDEDEDGYCDGCGKPMNYFVKVTDERSVTRDSKYLVIGECDGKLYALKAMPKDFYEGQIPAVSITADENGRIKYQTAVKRGAMITTLKGICDGDNWEDGFHRYGFHFTKDGKELLLSYDFVVEKAKYAKYGYHITFPDGGMRIVDGFYETWDEDKVAYLRLCTIGGNHRFVMTKQSGGSDYHAVSLYRMIGHSVFDGVTFDITDERSETDFSKVPGLDAGGAAAFGASTVGGMFDALSREGQEAIVSALRGEDDEISLKIASKITVTDYSAEAVSFSIDPFAYRDGDPTNRTPIDDGYFDGTPMTVTLCLGNVPFTPETVVHVRHDGTKDVYYPEYIDKDTPYKFDIEYDSEGNLFITFEVTDFSDITVYPYDVTGLPYEMNAYALSEGGETLEYLPTEGGCRITAEYYANRPTLPDADVILAAYDAAGRLKYTALAPAADDETSVTFTLPEYEKETLGSVKVFMIEKDTLAPAAAVSLLCIKETETLINADPLFE